MTTKDHKELLSITSTLYAVAREKKLRLYEQLVEKAIALIKKGK